jgi:hypothetical protein
MSRSSCVIEKAGNVVSRCRDASLDGGFGYLGRVRDQRRQQRGRAETGMRCADPADAVNIRLFVEQNAAAAIDLQIDETGDQHRPSRIFDRHFSGQLFADHDTG